MKTKQKIIETKEIDTGIFADIAIIIVTRFVLKLAVVFDTNALVPCRAGFTMFPVTIRGVIAIQPVVGSIRR